MKVNILNAKVIIVAPVSVLNNFREYIMDLGLDINRVEIYSYEKFTILFETVAKLLNSNAITESTATRLVRHLAKKLFYCNKFGA